MLPIKIAGLGWHLPEQRITNEDLESRLGIPASWMSRVSGVHERRYATHETSVSMAVAAAQMALADAGLRVQDVDAMVGASTGPQQTIPCTAALVQHALGAPEGISACFDVNATCLSFLFALQTVAHLVATGVYHNVLIFSSEQVSHSLNFQERESAILFGDAAAAAIITRSLATDASAYWHARFATYSSGADSTRLLGGGTLHHPNDPTTTPEMNMFHMRGPAVFKQAAGLIGPFLDTFFGELDWDRSQVDAVVPHQASRHAIEILTSRLGFQREQVLWNLAERGNTVAASIPLTLAEGVHAGRIKRGDKVVLLGSGAGLTLGATAITF